MGSIPTRTIQYDLVEESGLPRLTVDQKHAGSNPVEIVLWWHETHWRSCLIVNQV